MGGVAEVTVLAPDHADSRFPSWSQAGNQMAQRRRRGAQRSHDVFTGLLKRRHVILERARLSCLPEAFQDVLDVVTPQVVVLGRPFVAEYITQSRRVGAKVIIDADESLERVMKSIAAMRGPTRHRIRALMELSTAREMERREYQAADQVWVSSAIEQDALARHVNGRSVRIMPNIAPQPLRQASTGSIEAVGFVGWYRYAPNEAAAVELMAEIMPRLRAAGGPDLLTLIGREPTERMRRMAAKSSVRVTGEVDDVVRELHRAGVLVVPLRAGAGTRIKVLEAAAAGIPIVSTSFGVEGLAMRDGQEVLIAETAEEFAVAIRRLVLDIDLRRRVAEAAREYVRRAHAPEVLSAKVREALAELS